MAWVHVQHFTGLKETSTILMGANNVRWFATAHTHMRTLSLFLSLCLTLHCLISKYSALCVCFSGWQDWVLVMLSLHNLQLDICSSSLIKAGQQETGSILLLRSHFTMPNQPCSEPKDSKWKNFSSFPCLTLPCYFKVSMGNTRLWICHRNYEELKFPHSNTKHFDN